MSVEINETIEGGIRTIQVGSRKLDIYNSTALKDKLLAYLDQDPQKILIDLEDVEYIDSSGLGAIISTALTAENKGREIRICNLSEYVNSLFALNNLKDHVSIFDDADVAKAGW